MTGMVAIIVAIFGSTGFWQWLGNRKASNQQILSAIHSVEGRISAVEDKVESLAADAEETKAVTARVRILRFCDECQDGRRHSKDSFDQCLKDITDYERYCSEHPYFKNNQTVATVQYIKRLYEERLEQHDFL